MLAVLADASAQERMLRQERLVFEPKFDGIRAIVEVQPGGVSDAVRIWSRLGNDKTAQFLDLVEEFSRFSRSLSHLVLLDGEIVALDDSDSAEPVGFQHLQGRLHRRSPKRRDTAGEVPVAFIAFDLLRDGHEDLRPLPFLDRRARLERRFRRTHSRSLRLVDSVQGDGVRACERALVEGREGLIAKDPDARYQSGTRSPAWQKLKFVKTEEFVVGGWTEPRQSRHHFGALVVGLFDEGRGVSRSARGVPPTGPAHLNRRQVLGSGRSALTYAGQVGSGFTQADLERLAQMLKTLEASGSPFADYPRTNERVHWVRPELIVHVKFTEWTLDGVLRNPVYLGLRPDKKDKKDKKDKTDNKDNKVDEVRARPTHPTRPDPDEPRDAVVAQLDDLESQKKRGTLVLPGNVRIPVGNLHKVFWPKLGITKGELVRFYVRISPYLLPAVADRPLVMKRLPNGVDGKAFYQHRAPAELPEGIRVAMIRDTPEKAETEVPYLIGGSLETLLYMAQLAVISQDPWFSRVPPIEDADQAAFDLDPMPGAPFSRVLAVARWIHDELERLGAPSVPKTSGSGGLHIYIPLPPHTGYEAGMLFCQIVATIVATRHPQAATVERMVKGRPSGTVYIDYLQNMYGKTLATAYSARASEFAGVSTPLTWDEVHEGASSGLDPRDFTIRTVCARLDVVGDLWADLRASTPADLRAALQYAERHRGH